MSTRRLLIAATLALGACSGPTTSLSPTAQAARVFRPVSELFFLPDRAPVGDQPEADLVPDSKIEWDLRVTATNLGLGAVEVRVHAQAVVLSGVVPSAELRETMLRAAKATAGVKSLTADLQVVTPPPEP